MAYTGRVECASYTSPPYAQARALVLAWYGLPHVLIDGEPGSSYGQPQVLISGAADCVGHLENETTGGGMACASAAANAGPGATEAVRTTKTYTALAELM